MLAVLVLALVLGSIVKTRRYTLLLSSQDFWRMHEKSINFESMLSDFKTFPLSASVA